MGTITIPQHLYKSKYWVAVFYLFKEHPRLNMCFNTRYFDFSNERLKTRTLKKHAAPWSDSEKFMLDLALHLFNPSNKVDLSGMDLLDPFNTELALEAIKIRYG
ncbi:hypothetical protein DUZ99_02265 [Xylanibacillus composti]|uniref:Uncharacterized protein n=1 Tax=Xylanibacillus composti TaxID=1572762 RepID=A0A8J4H1R7_9BACL|nr:hypothetical protein [Xylanibacillus composti]MDT9723820.1 hypothetical protein [Xylanibacillus composti]GIQ67404.1 hypothetical protein XYCOK13_02280 [Xylanibacillus composti]